MIYDLIICGLGGVGSSVLYQASKIPNVKILGIDQYIPPHNMGSSHGETRIFRLANAEGDIYTRLALRSLEIWKEVNDIKIGQFPQIFTPTGGVIATPYLESSSNKISYDIASEIFNNTYAMALKYNISHKILSYDEINQYYGQCVQFKQKIVGYYEPTICCLHPEICIKKHISLASLNKANINLNEIVLGYRKTKNHTIEVETNKGIYKTNYLILTAGPWIKNLVNSKIKNQFDIYRQISLWFEVKEAVIDLYSFKNFPIFIIDLGDDFNRFACFPILNNRNSIKVISLGIHNPPTSPEEAIRDISNAEINYMYNKYIKPYFHGVTANCVKAESCFYTKTKDNDFIIDYLEGYNNKVILASPCSGHGFKHSTAIGEILTNLIFNKDNQNQIELIKFFKLEK